MNDTVTANNSFLVTVRCMTFNQAPYITETLNGFCIQQATFPFVCTIVDDFSTDGEQEVINQYLIENFNIEDKTTYRKEETDNFTSVFARHKSNYNCFFAVYFLKYNHTSIRKSKFPYISKWVDEVKYTAICEGDDFWTDPRKLQLQVSFLEDNPNYSMVCNKTAKFSQKSHQIIGTDFDNTEDEDLPIKRIILYGGLYISTCSIVFRSKSMLLSGSYPVYCSQCHVGDYPLQIMLAMNGKVRCLSNCMSVYRVDNSNSWIGRMNSTKQLTEKKLKGYLSEVRMLQGFSKDFPQYIKFFKERIRYYITNNMPYWKDDANGYKMYNTAFREYMKVFTCKELFLIRAEHRGGFLWFAYRQYRRAKCKLGLFYK